MNKDDISFDGEFIVYKGVKLNITRENIEDYRFQTGSDPIDLIKYAYNNSLSVIRDYKINKLLNDE
jgi:hypothetical protein